MRIWKCIYCSHEYNEAIGDPDNGISPGTKFEDVPEEWLCEECGAEKSDYELVD